MPRPTKAIRQTRLSAASAWKRGEKEEAYKLWEKAAASLKEHYTKKHNKKKPAKGEATPEGTEKSEGES